MMHSAGGFSRMSSLTVGGSVSIHSNENDSTASWLREGLAINSNKSISSSSTGKSPGKVTNVSNSPWSSAQSSHHHHLGLLPIAPTSTQQLAQSIPIQKARSFTSSSGYQQQHTTITTTRFSANYCTTPKMIILPKNGGLLSATSPSHRLPSFPGLSLSNSMDSGDVSRSGGNVDNESNHVRTTSAGYRDAFALLDDGKSGTRSDHKQQLCPSPKGFLWSLRASSPNQSGSGFSAIGDYSPLSQGGDSRVGAGNGESMLTVVTSHNDVMIPQFSIKENASIRESPVGIAATYSGKTVRAALPLCNPSPLRLKQSIANTWSKAKGIWSLVMGDSAFRGRSPNPSQLVSQTLMEDQMIIDGRPLGCGGEGITGSNAELRRFEEELHSTPAAGRSTRNCSPSPSIRNIFGEDGGSSNSSNQIGIPKWRIPSSPGRVRRKLKQVLAIPKATSFQGVESQQTLPPQSPQELLWGWAVATDSFDVDLDVDAESQTGKISSGIKELLISESELEGQEGGYFINKSSFNVFESNDFLKAMGDSVQASVAPNYIHTGDSFFDGELASDLDRAIHLYYAELGAILTRIKEWSLERDADSIDDVMNVADHYTMTSCRLCTIPKPQTNILLLAILSILLRMGNAHFCLKQYEDACWVYTSAQSC